SGVARRMRSTRASSARVGACASARLGAASARSKARAADFFIAKPHPRLVRGWVRYLAEPINSDPIKPVLRNNPGVLAGIVALIGFIDRAAGINNELEDVAAARPLQILPEAQIVVVDVARLDCRNVDDDAIWIGGVRVRRDRCSRELRTTAFLPRQMTIDRRDRGAGSGRSGVAHRDDAVLDTRRDRRQIDHARGQAIVILPLNLRRLLPL